MKELWNNIQFNKRKSLIAFGFMFLLLAGCTIKVNAKENITVPQVAEEKSVTLNVPQGDATVLIQDALDKAANNSEYRKVILSSGTYTIKQPLIVGSNTIIQATGATIKRTYDGSKKGSIILLNGPQNPEQREKTGGYNLTKNIWIIGGTWTGGDLKQASDESTNIFIAHATNVCIIGADFQNNKGGHLLEINSSKDVLIQDCSFNGYATYGSVASKKSMALEIDLAHGNCNKSTEEHKDCPNHESIPDGYKADDTACNNVRVYNNTFNTATNDRNQYFGTAIGSGTTLTEEGIYSTNIIISENKITHADGGAIIARGFKQMTISNNVISSGDGLGIGIKRCVNGVVEKNSISNVNAQGIFLYDGGSGVKVINNTISNTRVQNGVACHGIAVEGGTKVSSISNNTVNKVLNKGISLRQNGTKADIISNNTIMNAGQNGIFLSEKAGAGSIISNKISGATGNGIYVLGSGKISNIGSNEVKNSKKSGVMVFTSEVSKIEKNTVTGSAEHGICTVNKGTLVNQILQNRVENSGKHGIYVNQSAKVTNLTGNTVSGSRECGIYVNQAANVNSLSGNTVKNNTKADIKVASNAKVSKLGANTTSQPIKPATVNATSVALNPSKATIGVKEKLQLKATVKPTNTTNKKVTYSSSNKKVATVNSKGLVMGKKAGTAYVTVKTVNNKSKRIKITVKKAPSKISYTKKLITIKRNKKTTLKTKLSAKSASYSLTWKTSNKKIVWVDSKGRITAKKKGSAYITVQTYNKKKARIKVTVK